ncbi:hypothetical protein FIE12Z_12927 [Fusarium flagelliforme]|uniref:Uncharacterized protein n=1 Tax=Fusarium flagelliforme TaxID=2675880 RepID=A0A395M4P5_9HYPO|nr:hypothetical protein FIE12Z_12927 [Fusarium flagelliforme]
MRLIKARVLVEKQRISFEEFYGELPQYAILSHTWENNEEITLQECNTKGAKLKSGYDKIMKTCQLALADGLEYAWVDTCCIDKSSSAELTEAINSMFLWYQKAKICYVYLADKKDDRLSRCRWFTRGWTLQELIAPSTMMFFNHWWDCIGTKKSLVSDLSRISNIDKGILLHEVPISSACIAKRLSWAAYRKTTRVEDMAYCLLGICNIHMPMLYGEGKAAFRRLQEEIIKTTYDLSLLAWTPPDNSEGEYWGFLAESVGYFALCHSMYSTADSLLDEGEISISNKGLKLKARLFILKYSSDKHRYGLGLDYRTPGKDGRFLTIPMRKVGPNTFVRVRVPKKSGSDGKKGTSTSSRLQSVSADDNVFHNVTLLTTLPQLGAKASLSQKGNPDIVSFTRFATVKIELPPGIAMVSNTETPRKLWDMEDNVFFSPRGSYQNWGAVVLDTNSLFICFWQLERNDWVMRGAVLDMDSERVHALWKDLYLTSDDHLRHQKSVVAYLLDSAQEQMKFPGNLLGQEKGSALSFRIQREDDPKFCSGPRWRVVFEENVNTHG